MVYVIYGYARGSATCSTSWILLWRIRRLLGSAAVPIQLEPQLSSPWARGTHVSPIAMQSMIVAGGMYTTQELTIFLIN